MTLEVPATDRSYEERFRAFVERGRTLMQEPAVPRADDPSTIERFITFVRDAERLATAEAHAYLRWFAPFVRPARALLVDHDLLAIAGHSWIETSWCSLLAWALSPPRHSECALACQRAVLATCGIELSGRRAAADHLGARHRARRAGSGPPRARARRGHRG